MSKSVGNTLLVSEVVKRVRPVELRYYLLAAHYRSVIEFSEESLASDGRGIPAARGIRPACRRGCGGGGAVVRACRAFAEAMDDDLAVPQALAVLFEAVHEGNGLLAGGESAALRETWVWFAPCSACSVSTRWPSRGLAEGVRVVPVSDFTTWSAPSSKR